MNFLYVRDESAVYLQWSCHFYTKRSVCAKYQGTQHVILSSSKPSGGLPGIILWMQPANERRHIVMFFIG